MFPPPDTNWEITRQIRQRPKWRLQLQTPHIVHDYNLKVNTSLLHGRAFVMNLMGQAQDWTRSTDFFAGPWQGSFKIYDEKISLERMFYDWLGYDVEETTKGAVTWNGLIWEMDLVDFDEPHVLYPRRGMRGRRRRRSLEPMFNRVKVIYTNPEDDVPGETVWVEDLKSQTQYGIKEEILYRELNPSQALEAANEFLNANSWPRPMLIGFEDNVEAPYLEVAVKGYVATGQFRFTQTVDDTLTDVGAWVDAILGTDFQFLTKGRVDANTRPIYKTLRELMRAWELLDDLLTLRDLATSDRFRVHVDLQRRINYEIYSNAPVGYYRMGRFFNLNNEDMEDNPRFMQPGIYRDTSLAQTDIRIDMTNAFFQRAGDFLLESVEVTAEGLIVPRLGVYAEEEALTTFSFDPPEEEEDDTSS